MRVLLTGATGFLGKHVFNQLLAEKEIKSIYVVSRRKLFHSDSRVKFLRLDLSDPKEVAGIQFTDIDAVIHLAGNYNFQSEKGEDYSQNVLATQNLVEKTIRENEKRSLPFFYASTYAVMDPKHCDLIDESPLEKIEPTRVSYSTTKAMAEVTVSRSKIPGGVFRLGILVGDTQTGMINKIDGPYYLLEFLRKVSKIPGNQLAVKRLPVPGSTVAVLPVVPVDCAAKVFVEALKKPELREGVAKIYGVFHPESVSVDTIVTSFIEKYLPSAKPIYFEKVSPKLLEAQSYLTGIPSNLYRYSSYPTRFSNRRFQRVFSDCRIPHYHSYQDQLLSGYSVFSGDLQ